MKWILFSWHLLLCKSASFPIVYFLKAEDPKGLNILINDKVLRWSFSLPTQSKKSQIFIIIQHRTEENQCAAMPWLAAWRKTHLWTENYGAKNTSGRCQRKQQIVCLEPRIQTEISQPQRNDAEQSERRGSLQVAAYSLHLRSACYDKSKNYWRHWFGITDYNQPICLCADIELPWGFSLVRLCNALVGQLSCAMWRKDDKPRGCEQIWSIKAKFCIHLHSGQYSKEQRGFQKVVEHI